MSIILKIKRLLISGNVEFTEKAFIEIERDHLTPELVVEAILNAPAIRKTIVSHNPYTGQRENLYIITGQTYSGLFIYTKGKIRKLTARQDFYILISSKRDVSI